MDTVTGVHEMQLKSRRLRQGSKRVGLVPTMGYLHEGHLSLIRYARTVADHVVVSIFVNPAQFAPNEDLDRYPRDFERDKSLCKQEGVGTVFFPDAAEMYRPDHSVYVDETVLSKGLCGASRPTHFRGVTTVVAKLFNIVLPDVAVFGQKDAQQAAVIKRMVRDLNFPVEVVVVPIAREDDGLAMSSRNVYLAPGHRRQALCLTRALHAAEVQWRSGDRNCRSLREAMYRVLDEAHDACIDYVEFVDVETLEPVSRVGDRPVLVALAVRFGKTRLIDNKVLGAE